MSSSSSEVSSVDHNGLYTSKEKPLFNCSETGRPLVGSPREEGRVPSSVLLTKMVGEDLTFISYRVFVVIFPDVLEHYFLKRVSTPSLTLFWRFVQSTI